MARGNSGSGCGARISSAATLPRAESEAMGSGSAVSGERAASNLSRAWSGRRRVRNSGMGVRVAGFRWQVAGGRLAEPEGESQKIGCETEDGEGGGGEEFPVGRVAIGDSAELDDLKEGKRQGQKRGRDKRQRVSNKRRGEKEQIGEGKQAVMQRDGALPAESAKHGSAVVFFVFGIGGKVQDEEVGRRQHGQWEKQEREKAGVFAGLKEKADGRDDVCNVQGEDEFAEAAVDQAKGRDGVGQGKDEG